jgi:hypothetical protein
MLNQFGSNLIDKLDYMVLFSSSKLNLCSLRATLGFVQMRVTDVTNIRLIEYKPGIFIPPDDFFTADPLPDEWMEIIPRLSSTSAFSGSDKTRGSYSARTYSRNKPTPTRQRPASALSSLVRKNKTFLASQGLSTYMNGKEEENKPIRPFSAGSRSLSIRAKSVAKLNSLDNKQFNLSYKNVKETPIVRPRSASVSGRKGNLSSRLLLTVNTVAASNAFNNGDQLERPRKAAFAVDLENLNSDDVDNDDIGSPLGSSASDDLRNLPRYGPKELVWILTVRIPSVHEMNSNVDETWIMTFKLLNIMNHEFESFQLFGDGGPLIFDVELEYFLIATEENLLALFGKERLFKVVFTSKFVPDEEYVAAIDMRQLQKSLSLDQDVPVEKIRSDEVDDAKFLDADSDDEMNPFTGDQHEEDDSDDDELNHNNNSSHHLNNTKVKVSINVKKLGRIIDMEHEATEEIIHQATAEEFNIHILKGKPFPLPQAKKSALKKN